MYMIAKSVIVQTYIIFTLVLISIADTAPRVLFPYISTG